jgi:hypothetical protein
MITELQKQFCREVCALAAKHELSALQGKFRSGFFQQIKSGESSDAEVSFSWDSGRHNANSDKIYVTSVDHIHLKLDGPKT